MQTVSLPRLYGLRALYLFVVVGTGAYIWPTVLNPGPHPAPTDSMASCMIAGFSILCLIGIRYPLMILPVLMWEIVWKTLWLVIVPLPQWLHGHVDDQIKPAVFAVAMVVLVYLAVPWAYVFATVANRGGDRWR